MSSAAGAGAQHHPVQGVLLILGAALCFASMDSTIRGLSIASGFAVPVMLILSLRYTTQAALMALWLGWRRGRAGFAVAHPRFQALRGLLLLATSLCSFFGVHAMPVPEFTAINMLTPVLVTLLAGIVLHERVSRLRWALVVGAFAGALIVIRPGSGLFGWAVLFPLLGACTYASFQVLTRRMAGLDDPDTTHFWTGAVGTALLWPALAALCLPRGHLWFMGVLGDLGRLPALAWALIALVGVLGTVGHLLLIFALGKAPTATLMPFIYLQIAVAAGLGWLFFHHLPDAWGWVGMAVIGACGAATAALNLGAATPADVAPPPQPDRA